LSVELKKVIDVINEFEHRVKVLQDYIDKINSSDESAKTGLAVYTMIVKHLRVNLLGEKIYDGSKTFKGKYFD